MSDSQGRDGPMRAGSPTTPSFSTHAASYGAHSPTPSNHVASSHAAADPARTRTADLEPLGFKVPPQFNQDFRRFAFENGYKLNELLFAAFEAFKKSRIRESANS
jgi:hypothetical protein